jgi:MFS family permease
MRISLRAFDPQLPRDVWLLQLGGVMNSFGNGVVLPFLVIYLHDVRGFGLGVSGLVVSVSAAAQLSAGVLAGPLVDRLGARSVLAAGLVLQAVGFGLFPLVRSPWHAFVLIALEGTGSAGFWPSQSTLIARLTPAARRHAAFAQQRVTMNLGIGLGGLTGGLIATVARPGSFTTLFLVDAATFLAYVAVLAAIRDPGLAEEDRGAERASYAAVLRDRVFVGLWALNFLFVAAGYALFNLVPPFARDHAHVSERQIGIFFFVNTALIVIVQLPISRVLEGRSS